MTALEADAVLRKDAYLSAAACNAVVISPLNCPLESDLAFSNMRFNSPSNNP